MATSSLLLIGGLGTPELMIILLVVLLLFGGKKIPELMRGLGKGVRNFKEGVSGIEEEINRDPAQPRDNVKKNAAEPTDTTEKQ